MSVEDIEILPWRVTATREIVRDRWISLRADTCVTAAGATIEPYYVLKPDDWVNILAIDAQGRAVMVRQYRHGLGRNSLELPGGVIDRDDASPAVAAQRELLEETGYACEQLMPVGSFSPNPANHANRVFAFAARGARQLRSPEREPGETMRTELIPLADLRGFALSGGIEHGLHIAVVLMALAALGQ